jgi:prepilin-type N-terminal cleavage/methylation domain-containing protein
MRLQIKKNNITKQKGFTLMELLIGVAIAGLLAGGIAEAIHQIIMVNANDSSRMTAVKQIESTIDMIRQDALMAQMVIAYPDLYPRDGNPDGVLMLRWTDWTNNVKNEVIYLRDGNCLKRKLLKDGIENSTKTVASNIKSFNFDNADSFSYCQKVTLTISSEVESLRSAVESRTFDVRPRPIL